MNIESIDWFTLIQIFIFIVMTFAALYTVFSKDLMWSIVALAIFSLLLSLEFYLLQAPDVAIAEAAIGAGLTTAIYTLTIKQTVRREDELNE
ncbi:MAG: hypothetical protein DRN35_01390 [Thermoplasmata archaeon]|nr:MAG: hypothetical protein DRN40_02960 [Thermoplasmata archaeon]RLF71974.1 MAG: hypothetical protein DRN35_01390 [Thermoplasmata archaeon]RLF75597.1 MAG: hypothetical protein DRN42_02570 [Thermoplasmata archaeon]HDD60574.1 DUF4040 domain-containing protein [Euryarchaeota archaeon]